MPRSKENTSSTEDVTPDDLEKDAEAMEEAIESQMAFALSGMVKDLLTGPLLVTGLNAAAENENEFSQNIGEHLQKLGPAIAADFDRMLHKYYTAPSSPATSCETTGDDKDVPDNDQQGDA